MVLEIDGASPRNKEPKRKNGTQHLIGSVDAGTQNPTKRRDRRWVPDTEVVLDFGDFFVHESTRPTAFTRKTRKQR